ncbi:ATP-grasp domain-containing protein [Vibrio chagasii]|uniref:ATP-grasp domain-containing protein n=1 Tax=Vibrio chagasii TaxID=170679 RepID=UPI002284E79B|nr:hypothetical protein [Vibrio chagasii]MCY9829344.1 hypothetical protein [Vibrio chagasii]
MKTNPQLALLWIMDFNQFTSHQLESATRFYKDAFREESILLYTLDSNTLACSQSGVNTINGGINITNVQQEIKTVYLISDFSGNAQQHKLLNDIKGYLRIQGIPVANPVDAVNGLNLSDKLSTSMWLKSHGFPHIKTQRLLPGFDLQAFRDIQPPFIVKPSDMARGFGVNKVESLEALGSLGEILSDSPRSFVVQEYIECGADARLYFSKGELITHQSRLIGEDSYMANVSKGAVSVKGEINDEMILCGSRISKKLSHISPFIAIDFLCDKAGNFYVSEIEGILAGYSGVNRCDQPKVTRAIAKYLYSLVK